jgi:cytochrome c-type biogenesis protein CcmF
VITNLKVGETFKSEKLNIYFENITKKNEKNFESFVGEFVVENSQGDVFIMKPELRIYNQPNIATSEAYIRTSLFSDKFMTMNLVQNQEYLNVRYQMKPLMIWIWISILIISFGGVLSLFKKKYEN